MFESKASFVLNDRNKEVNELGLDPGFTGKQTPLKIPLNLNSSV